MSASDNFDTVLGTRRGSPSAQKQRDDAEVSHRQRVRDEGAETFVSFVKNMMSSAGLSADALISAYGVDGYPPQGAATLQDHLMALAHTTDTRGLAVIAALGDPEGWPGLTAPAVTALGSYYTSHIHDSEQLSRQVSGVLFDLCFLRNPERDSFFKGSEHDEAHYLRLQPLCASLAEFVRNQPQLPGTAFLVNMAAAMELAPVAALAGPLHSWVLAFAERYDVGTLPDDVWGPLNSLIHEHKDNAQFASAFAPLIERRRQRYQAILADATAAVKPVPPPLTWWRRYLDFRWGSTFETRK